MIVLDIETSGLDFVKNGIWQIAAIDMKSGKQFISEGRIDDEDEILMSADPRSIYPAKSVLEIVGKTEDQLKDKKKQSQKELIQEFFRWLENLEERNFICQNPQFDWGFLTVKARKYGLKIPYHHRSFDIHSIAQTKYFQIKGKFLMDGNHSGMNLTKVLKFCGMKDERKKHNALEDAKLTAECFSRLIHGKNLFKEFDKSKVPDYLEEKTGGFLAE